MSTDPSHFPPGTPLAVPVPPYLAETLGYAGESRFVAFRWEPMGDEVVYDDGVRSGTGASHAFRSFRWHPAVEPHLAGHHLGSSEHPARQWLVLDREQQRLYVAEAEQASRFVREQHPPPLQLTPWQQHQQEQELRDQVADFLHDPEMEEVPVDPTAVQREMDRERNAIAAMLAFLDQSLPHSPDRLPGL